jgi:hypothetical protein
MGRFLKAAYEVLERTDRALSAAEIVGQAKTLGLLSTSGQTPAQTMKSKLSTDILTKGENSQCPSMTRCAQLWSKLGRRS